MAVKDHCYSKTPGYTTECGRDSFSNPSRTISAVGMVEFRQRWMRNIKERKRLCYKCADWVLTMAELKEYPKP